MTWNLAHIEMLVSTPFISPSNQWASPCLMETKTQSPNAVTKVNDYNWPWNYHHNLHKEWTDAEFFLNIDLSKDRVYWGGESLGTICLGFFVLFCFWDKLYFSNVCSNSQVTKDCKQELYKQNTILQLFLGKPEFGKYSTYFPLHGHTLRIRAYPRPYGFDAIGQLGGRMQTK